MPEPSRRPVLRPTPVLLRRLAPLAAVTVAAITVLSLVAATSHATPPSNPSPLPPEAFRPVGPLNGAEALATSSPTPPAPTGEILPRPLVRRTPTSEPTAPEGPEHVVRTGDTLWQIAAWHRADLDLILQWNPDLDPRRIVAGQRVLVPGGRPMPTPAPTPKASTQRDTSPRSATHLWPLPVRGTITTRFSAAHPGIDVAARAGTPVRAIGAGVVTWAGWKTNGGGYVVVIRHPDGMVSTYNHNRVVTVRVGQEVARGEQIAAVGATGWATGPHLDLRIRMGGELIDPLRLDWAR